METRKITRTVSFRIGNQIEEDEGIFGNVEIRGSKEKQDLIEEKLRRFLDEAADILPGKNDAGAVTASGADGARTP